VGIKHKHQTTVTNNSSYDVSANRWNENHDIEAGTITNVHISESADISGSKIDISSIDHDSLLNYNANKHIDHTEVSITGSGLLDGQGGTLDTNRVFSIENSDIDHDQLNNFDSNKHIDHSAISITGAGILVGQGGDLTANRVFTFNNSDIDHDSLTNTHNLTTDIDHGSISGLVDDDHTQYLKADGTRQLAADWNAGSYKITTQEFAGWGIVPVGGVIAWLKSFTNTPSLPDGYVECNGQVLSDSDSVYNGQTIPDLNSGTYHRFLRGAATSGGTGGQTTHKHDFLAYNVGLSLGLVYYYFPASNTTYYVTMYPRYYEVVWVLRIK
jgi:hypothetical protein